MIARRFLQSLGRAGLAAAAGGWLACATIAMSAQAVDMLGTSEAPDLAGVRAKVKAGDFKAAAGELQTMIDAGVQHADVYNLLGFSLRKSGDLQGAGTFYAKALEFDPDHRGALEYQGELFIETGKLGQARANLERLRALCREGCEELDDLEKVVVAAERTKS